MKIYVVGAGPGEACYLTEHAKKTVMAADVVVATKRLYGKLRHLNANTVCKDIAGLAEFVEQTNEAGSVCVLASGDVGFYSVSKMLAEKLPGMDVEYISGVSSLQYLTARLGLPYDDAKCVSLHGRDTSATPHVCYNRKVFALTGGKTKAHDVIAELAEAGLGGVWVAVGENLSDEDERIVTGEARSLLMERFCDLSAMLVVNDGWAKHYEPIEDAAFIRGKTPMTKSAVRTLSLAALRIAPGDTVADIGAGTGSVSVEAARRAHEGLVFAVEREPDAISLIKENIIKFGAYNVRVVSGSAPQALEALPAVAKAFIGGSGGKMAAIVDALLAKNAAVRVVANAVTLETLREADEVLRERGFAVDISCVNVANAQSVGGYRIMKAENPIYIISGERQ